MKSNTNGMYELEICKGIKIDTANGSTSMVTHIGNYKGKVQCADGTESVIIMKNIKVVPGLVKNLFSLSTVMRNDWDLLTETKADNKVENKEKQRRIQIRQKGIGKCKWRIFDVNGNCT